MQNFRQNYCFLETRYFVWKIASFDKLQLPQIVIIFLEALHTFPTYQYLFLLTKISLPISFPTYQKSVRDFV